MGNFIYDTEGPIRSKGEQAAYNEGVEFGKIVGQNMARQAQESGVVRETRTTAAGEKGSVVRETRNHGNGQLDGNHDFSYPVIVFGEPTPKQKELLFKALEDMGNGNSLVLPVEGLESIHFDRGYNAYKQDAQAGLMGGDGVYCKHDLEMYVTAARADALKGFKRALKAFTGAVRFPTEIDKWWDKLIADEIITEADTLALEHEVEMEEVVSEEIERLRNHLIRIQSVALLMDGWGEFHISEEARKKVRRILNHANRAVGEVDERPAFAEATAGEAGDTKGNGGESC